MMQEFILLLVGVLSLMVGSTLGYYARQSIAKRKAGTLEAKLQERIDKAKEQGQKIISRAKEQAEKISEAAKQEERHIREELLKSERFLRRRESSLEDRILRLKRKEREIHGRKQGLDAAQEELKALKIQAEQKLEQASGLSKETAREELFQNLEKRHQLDLLARMKKLEEEGFEKYEKRAKEILTLAIQKFALEQTQEVTTSTVSLPNEEIKGRIIGKEGRNIRALEKLTGVEIVVDDTPEMVVVSGFNPLRREIAKLALKRLIRDGRIQPARIEEEVKKAEKEIAVKTKQFGEQALYEIGVVGLNPKLVQALGRLYFRTSYGQNVLLHSIEVAHLAMALAAEIGASSEVCKLAGLLHDIGKALDRQVEGSHVNIGIKILEKFGVDQKVIDAMKSHHDEYSAESLEAIIIKVADQISGGRPGARKDTLEDYLKRLESLEKIALSYPGVEKAWALQAGREIRVFVKPEEIDDWTTHKMAREIADDIQRELHYPGEIKVNVIREKRVTEYAR